MAFTLIKGAFHLDAGMPDGDSVRFMADDDRLFDGLRGRPVEFKSDGTVQLRYEGIDTIEKAATQPLAGDSRDKNFELLREAADQFSDTPRGYILTRQTDGNRRPVCFVFSGDSSEADGADVFLDGPRTRQSVNYKMLDSGYAYTMFYETLFMEIRQELSAAFVAARTSVRGLHPTDATLAGVRLTSRNDLATVSPIFPKLWRRLEEYLRNHASAAGFKVWLRSRRPERLSTLSDQRTSISFDNVVDEQGDTVKLLYSAEDMVFRPA
jgi:endonuclease YncB( thermonuclease family)